jgi:hypothetical protein
MFILADMKHTRDKQHLNRRATKLYKIRQTMHAKQIH